MRVLLLHNYYRSANASGENLSVADEIAGLRNMGWDIEVISADSDAIADGLVAQSQLALRPLYSRPSVRRLESTITRFRPHVALVENLFPLHSPAVISTLHRAGVPIAAGVRSYRMWCVRSSMFRNGEECRQCEGTLLNAPAIRHRCYQNQATASIPMALGLAIHRSTWQKVDRYLAVSDHVARELLRFGIAPNRITIRANFVPDPGIPTLPGRGFLYAGRLTADKGIDILIDAWRRSEVWRDGANRLTVAGSGPLLGLLENVEPELNVEAVGLISHTDVLRLTVETAVTVIPSNWQEPFGRGVIEAASRARPALVTDRGGLPELVVDGVTGWVATATADAIAQRLRSAIDPVVQRQFGLMARRRYEERYTEEISLDILTQNLLELAGRH